MSNRFDEEFDGDDEGDAASVAQMRVHKAQDAKLSYGSAEVLHQSTRQRVTVVPWYVDRTNGRETSFKVTTETRKKDSTGVFAWMDAEEKSLTLNPAAAARLCDVVRKAQQVAEQKSDGNFLVISVQEGVADVAGLDPQVVGRAVAGLLQKRDVVRHLADQDLGPELISALRGAIRVRELRSALAQLRTMLAAGESNEAQYQDWCRLHSWAFGSAVLVPDKVRQIAVGDSVDFLVPSSLTGLRDLIELKRPDMAVISYDKGHRNWYWAGDTARAIGQVHRYLDALHESARNGLRDHPEIVAYHPRATVVIGRSNDWASEQLTALHGLNARLNAIQIMTYDQLVSLGERVVEGVVGHVEDGPSGERREDDSF